MCHISPRRKQISQEQTKAAIHIVLLVSLNTPVTPIPVNTYPKKTNRKIEHKPVYQKEQASASMKAERHNLDKGGGPISLNSSERIPLERTETGEDIEITVKSGVIRIAASQSKHAEDITLAFTCRADVCKFHYPENLELSIEAITDTTYTVGSISKVESDTSDAIMDWIIQLHIIRHEKNLENRLIKLFRLLISRLGKRTSEGLLLEHTLSHARIAEIVGSTRSTVSRTISTLRKSKQIYIDELKGQIILPVD